MQDGPTFYKRPAERKYPVIPVGPSSPGAKEGQRKKGRTGQPRYTGRSDVRTGGSLFYTSLVE